MEHTSTVLLLPFKSTWECTLPLGLDILQEYKRKDDRFVILQQRHAGAGAARNHGIKLAEGKYIQFLDSDDYFEPTLLEEILILIDKKY